MAKITEEELKTLQDQEKDKGAIMQDLAIIELKKHELLHMFASIQSSQEESLVFYHQGKGEALQLRSLWQILIFHECTALRRCEKNYLPSEMRTER